MTLLILFTYESNRMTRKTIFILLILLLTQVTVAQTVQQCATETSPDTLDDNLRFFFTMPLYVDDEYPHFALWYADNTGLHDTSMSWPDAMFFISPSGKQLLIANVSERFLMTPLQGGYHDYGGSYYDELILIDTNTLARRTLNLPEAFYQRRQAMVHWLDEEHIMFTSIWDGIETVTVDIVNERIVDTQLWQTEDLALWANQGGTARVSPNSEYLFYTTDEIVYRATDIYIMEDVPWIVSGLTWRIVDRDGNVVLDYIEGTYGHFSNQWFPDSSAILLYSLDNETLRVALDGNVTTLYSDRLYLIAMGTENHIASSVHDSLITLNMTTGQPIDHCQEAILIIAGNWSADERYLPYKLENSNRNDVRILDVVNNTYVSIMPYPPESDADASAYIRLIGWSYLEGE